MSYVDLHCHILPGLDDGSRSLNDTVRFARRLDAENVLDVATTPHIKHTHHPFDVRILAGLRKRVQDAITAEGLRVTLHQAGELAHEDALTLDPEELQLIAQGPESAPWLLLECPFDGLPARRSAARLRQARCAYGLRPPGPGLAQ